ncbi:MAG TPA: hypothetical protein VN047_18345, partial [Sphingopyxis sp.]|uniref:hypothetical protein n=1 Tax=Sphingopyxis sp. TaxID=1908224 RepID=UPI002CCB6A3E
RPRLRRVRPAAPARTPPRLRLRQECGFRPFGPAFSLPRSIRLCAKVAADRSQRILETLRAISAFRRFAIEQGAVVIPAKQEFKRFDKVLIHGCSSRHRASVTDMGQ